MCSSAYTNIKYNKAHIHSIFDKRLKEIDNEYLTSYVNMRKYPIILFVMAKIMEMTGTEQNQIAMYLYNYKFRKIRKIIEYIQKQKPNYQFRVALYLHCFLNIKKVCVSIHIPLLYSLSNLILKLLIYYLF